MPIVDVFIPQMGEGLQEVCILGFHKRPGATVQRDEPLYSMETDKAAMEVESPHAGVLKEWLAEEGAVLAIGAPIARIETAADATPPPLPASPGENKETRIPPRTRAYCRELGISEEETRRITARSGKLMPADVDAYLLTRTGPVRGDGGGATPRAPETYVDRPLSPQHRTFLYRLKRSAGLVIPAVAKRPMEWRALGRYADAWREHGAPVQPSTFQTFAYCVAQAVQAHPKFRSTFVGEDRVREFAHVNLGIAVGLPDGQLTTAVVPNADSLPFAAFVRTARERIQRAREGEDQVDESTQLLLTYMGAYDIVDAVPVLVAPAVAVLFVGSSYEQSGQTLVNLVLTFDHRLIQGVEAALFLGAVVEKVKALDHPS